MFLKNEEKLQLKNIQVFTEIPTDEFLQIMISSSAVVLPLDTEAPAGLIVLFQAGANEIPVIISDTVTTREYINSERGYLCGKNVEEWKKTIETVVDSPDARKHAKEFKQFLQTECNELQFVNGIKSIIKKFGV